MKAMTSCCWALALNLLILWPLAGRLVADEIDERSDVDAAAAESSGSEISVSETAAEPSAMQPQEETATELDEPTASEPGVLPAETESDAAEVPADETDNPERVITPLPEGSDDQPMAPRGRSSGPSLTPASARRRPR